MRVNRKDIFWLSPLHEPLDKVCSIFALIKFMCEENLFRSSIISLHIFRFILVTHYTRSLRAISISSNLICLRGDSCESFDDWVIPAGPAPHFHLSLIGNERGAGSVLIHISCRLDRRRTTQSCTQRAK